MSAEYAAVAGQGDNCGTNLITHLVAYQTRPKFVLVESSEPRLLAASADYSGLDSIPDELKRPDLWDQAGSAVRQLASACYNVDVPCFAIAPARRHVIEGLLVANPVEMLLTTPTAAVVGRALYLCKHSAVQLRCFVESPREMPTESATSTLSIDSVSVQAHVATSRPAHGNVLALQSVNVSDLKTLADAQNRVRIATGALVEKLLQDVGNDSLTPRPTSGWENGMLPHLEIGFDLLPASSRARRAV